MTICILFIFIDLFHLYLTRTASRRLKRGVLVKMKCSIQISYNHKSQTKIKQIKHLKTVTHHGLVSQPPNNRFKISHRRHVSSFQFQLKRIPVRRSCTHKSPPVQFGEKEQRPYGHFKNEGNISKDFSVNEKWLKWFCK